MPSRATDQSGRRDRRMRWSASGRPRELWRGANLGRQEYLRTAATALAAPQAKPHAIRCRGSRAEATSARMSRELEASSLRSSRPDRSIVGPGIKIKRRLPLTRLASDFAAIRNFISTAKTLRPNLCQRL
jgi:hypothetical protein